MRILIVEDEVRIADFLEREYQVDKAGTREALYGGEDSMQEQSESQDDLDRLVQVVGPWGAIRRRKK